MLLVSTLLLERILVVRIGKLIPHLKKRSSSLAQSSPAVDQSDYNVSVCESHSFNTNDVEINDEDYDIDEENLIDRGLL